MSHGNGIARPRGAAATRVLANAFEGTRDIRQHFPRVENSEGENVENFGEPAVAPRATPHPQHAALQSSDRLWRCTTKFSICTSFRWSLSLASFRWAARNVSGCLAL